MIEKMKTLLNRNNNKKKNIGRLSARELARITRENRRITGEIERERNRKNVPESEYLTTMNDPENVVEFDHMRTYFFTDIGTVKAVDGVTFEIPRGKTVGVVGESGCGKSVTALSLIQLVQRPQGQILLRVRVTEAGSVDSVEVIEASGYPAFDSAAVRGARQLRYNPARRNGDRISVWARVPVHFTKGTT